MLGRRLMIGVDRLDYSKGLVERFQSLRTIPRDSSENQNRVTFMQIAPLSRADVRAYAEIRRDLEQTTGRTNGRFADTDWTPIRYLNRNFPHDVLMGFMRSAQVGIVTPVRDGMNLVAKEFVAAQDPADPGVLILSTLAGAARELGSAVMVESLRHRVAWHMPSSRRSTCRSPSGASVTRPCWTYCAAIRSRPGIRVSCGRSSRGTEPRLKRRTGMIPHHAGA